MPYPQVSLFPLTSGIHLGIPSHRLPAGFSPNLRNVRIRDGQIAKRPGYRSFVDLWRNDADNADIATAAGVITGLFEYRHEDGTIDVIACTGGAALANRRIYKYSTARWLNITDPTLYDAAGADDLIGTATDTWDATVAPNASQPDAFYASNGHVTTGAFELIKFTGAGTAAAMQAGPGPARYLSTYANRLILGHIFDVATGNIRGNRVAWSAYGDADTWSGATSGATDLIDTPDNITRLIVLRGQLVIFKTHSIYIGRETGLSTVPIAFELFSRDRGAPGGHTVAVGAGLAFFLDHDNVYVFDGASTPVPIGGPIRAALANINPSQRRQAFAMIDEKNSEYWLFAPEGDQTYPKQAWVFSWLERHWTRWDFAHSLTAGCRGTGNAAEIWGTPGGIDAKGTTWSEADASGVTWAEMSTSGAENLVIANFDQTAEEISPISAVDGATAIDAFWDSPDIDFNGQPGSGGRALATSDLKTLSRVSVRLKPGVGAMTLVCEVSPDGGQSFRPTSPVSTTTPSAGGVIHFDTWITSDRFRVRLRNNVANQGFPGPEELVLQYIPREESR